MNGFALKDLQLRPIVEAALRENIRAGNVTMSARAIALLICLGFMTGNSQAQNAGKLSIKPKNSADVFVRARLEFDKPNYFLGENVLAHFTLTNVGRKPLTVDDSSLTLTAQNSAGKSVFAPYRRLMGIGFRMSPIHTLLPGQALTRSFPLHKYLRFDSDGSYSVRVQQNMIYDGSQGPYPIHTSARVSLVMPTSEQATKVVEEMARLPEAYNDNSGEKAQPFVDFSALHYAVYLPILKRHVARSERFRFESLEAMGDIPTVEATQSLVELVAKADLNVDKSVPNQAAYWLSHRLPLTESEEKAPPARAGKVFEVQKELAKETWRPEFAPALRTYARKWLLSQKTVLSTEYGKLNLGADILERIGTRDDMPFVLKALNGTIGRITKLWRVPGIDESSDEPFNREMNYEALIATAQALIKRGAPLPPAEGSPAQIAVFLRVAADNPALRPRDWQQRQLRLLRHPLPFIRQAVLRSLTWETGNAKSSHKTPALHPAVLTVMPRLLTDSDTHVIEAACDLLAQRKERRFLPTILRMLRTSKNKALLYSSHEMAQSLGARYEAWQIWARRLDEPNMSGIAIEHLMKVVGGQTGSGSNGDPDIRTARKLKKNWQRFLKVHRARLKSGRLFSISEPALKPELAPPGFNISSGRKIWPPHR